VEEVQLMRGGEIVVSLLGAFGQSLKETRLTAWLGYLLSMKPERLAPLFGFKGDVLEISLENYHEDGRSDIFVKTSQGLGVIEAKVDATDASAQLKRYQADWRALLTLGYSNTKQTGISHVHWQDLADCLDIIAKTAPPAFKFLATQFIKHLEEHHMIKKTEPLEIYAREINEDEPVSLELFIKGRIYGCHYEKRNKVAEAQYFAPHFGDKINRQKRGIPTGISYVARVEHVFQATTWGEFKEGVCKHRKKQWWNSHQIRKVMQDLRREWIWNKKIKCSFLLLREPRLVFNPPVRKENLRRDKSKVFFIPRLLSFDELFAAWGR
jgi:hypothetical protein